MEKQREMPVECKFYGHTKEIVGLVPSCKKGEWKLFLYCTGMLPHPECYEGFDKQEGS